MRAKANKTNKQPSFIDREQGHSVTHPLFVFFLGDYLTTNPHLLKE